MNPTRNRVRAGWAAWGIGAVVILYVVGYQFAHLDLTQLELLAILWPHCLVGIAFILLGQYLMGLLDGRPRGTHR